MQKHLRHCPSFLLKWPVHDLMLVIPSPPLIKVASITRPYSKLGGTEWREEKVDFSWKCLNIFATGCSTSRKSFPAPFSQGEIPFLSFSTPAPTLETFCSSLLNAPANHSRLSRVEERKRKRTRHRLIIYV